jgi:hypothetical protein
LFARLEGGFFVRGKMHFRKGIGGQRVNILLRI